jgi:hypothetical protein
LVEQIPAGIRENVLRADVERPGGGNSDAARKRRGNRCRKSHPRSAFRDRSDRPKVRPGSRSRHLDRSRDREFGCPEPGRNIRPAEPSFSAQTRKVRPSRRERCGVCQARSTPACRKRITASERSLPTQKPGENEWSRYQSTGTYRFSKLIGMRRQRRRRVSDVGAQVAEVAFEQVG